MKSFWKEDVCTLIGAKVEEGATYTVRLMKQKTRSK